MKSYRSVVSPLLAVVAVIGTVTTLAAVEGCASQDSSPSPPQVSEETDGGLDPQWHPLPSAKAKQIAVGRLHACALTTEGGVRCWGYTEYGQLGDGELDRQPKPAVPLPVAVIGLASGVQQISTFNDTTCALTAAGGVKCWGADELGELGTGIPYVDTRKKASAVPVDVKGLTSGVRAISVGFDHACALTMAGGVKCWGHDEYGKLGNGSTHTTSDGAPDLQPPVDVVGLTSEVKEISAGWAHTCALTVEGSLKCWGRNAGELGITKTDGSGSYAKPVDVVALGSNVAHVYAGGAMTCVIMKDTSAKCFGNDDNGQGGDGQDGVQRTNETPVDVMGLTGATEISNGGRYTCAIASGAVKCWGRGLIGNPDSAFASFVPICSVRPCAPGARCRRAS